MQHATVAILARADTKAKENSRRRPELRTIRITQPKHGPRTSGPGNASRAARQQPVRQKANIAAPATYSHHEDVARSAGARPGGARTFGRQDHDEFGGSGMPSLMLSFRASEVVERHHFCLRYSTRLPRSDAPDSLANNTAYPIFQMITTLSSAQTSDGRRTPNGRKVRVKLPPDSSQSSRPMRTTTCHCATRCRHDDGKDAMKLFNAQKRRKSLQRGCGSSLAPFQPTDRSGVSQCLYHPRFAHAERRNVAQIYGQRHCWSRLPRRHFWPAVVRSTYSTQHSNLCTVGVHEPSAVAPIA